MWLANGGSLFTLSKILGHSSIAITERCYSHLMPRAFEADYGRVPFHMPTATPVAPLRAV
jgi:integrase